MKKAKEMEKFKTIFNNIPNLIYDAFIIEVKNKIRVDFYNNNKFSTELANTLFGEELELKDTNRKHIFSDFATVGDFLKEHSGNKEYSYTERTVFYFTYKDELEKVVDKFTSDYVDKIIARGIKSAIDTEKFYDYRHELYAEEIDEEILYKMHDKIYSMINNLENEVFFIFLSSFNKSKHIGSVQKTEFNENLLDFDVF